VHDGRDLVGAGAFLVDITERVEVEQRLALLGEVGLTLDAALGVDERLSRLCRLLVPRVADMCFVQRAEAGAPPRQIAALHVDPAHNELMRSLRVLSRIGPDAPPRAAQVLNAGEPLLVERADESLLRFLAPDDVVLDRLRGLALASCLLVPLAARGRTGGMLFFALSGVKRRYGPADVALARELGRRVGLALDNAGLYEREHAIARTLQESLLPTALPEIPGLEVAAAFRAVGAGVEVGGDFYDVFESSDDAWCLVIGDVCGKGPEAASLTALARYTLRAVAVEEPSPAAALLRLNQAILRQRSDGRFLTAVLARVEVAEGGARVVLARGGHPPPLVVRADGRVEEVATAGPALGLVGEPQMAEAELTLEADDVLVLYTDGVTEGRRGRELFGTGRLRQALGEAASQSAAAVVTRLETTLAGFEGDTLRRDDVAVVAIRAVGLPSAPLEEAAAHAVGADAGS
jgi:serine phosphatase RsbU (regulator of sigma subunit)